MGAPLLPDGLEELRLRRNFNLSIENIRLPVGLKRLMITFQSKFDQGLTGVMWPPGLKELDLRGSFNQPMERIPVPETLRELSLGQAFTYSLQGVAVPDGLERLPFCMNYPSSHIFAMDWPRCLRRLHVASSRFGCKESVDSARRVTHPRVA